MAENNGGTCPRPLDLLSEEQLKCQKCTRFFQDPRVLPCLHIACKACCVDGQSDSGQQERSPRSRETGGGVQCPACRARFPVSPDKLPTALSVDNMVQATQILQTARETARDCESCRSKDAVFAYCADCGCFQCLRCYENHMRMKGLKEHKVTTVTAMLDKYDLLTKLPGAKCTKHSMEKAELYCCSCKSFACSRCVPEHLQSPHQLKHLKDCVPQFKEEVCSVVRSLQQEVALYREGKVDASDEIKSLGHCERQLQVTREELNNKGEKLWENEQNSIKSIEEAFLFYKDFIEVRQAKLLDEIKKLYENQKCDFKLELKSCEELQSSIKVVQSFMEYMKHMYDEEIVSTKPLVCDRVEQMREKYKELEQKLKANIIPVATASFRALSEGVGDLSVAVGKDIKFSARVTTSFCGPSSGVDISVQTDQDASDSSQGPGHSTSASNGAISYDLTNIMASVSAVADQWKELGSSLGLQPVILNTIQGPPGVCLVEMIKKWIDVQSQCSLNQALAKMGRKDLLVERLEPSSLLPNTDYVMKGPPLISQQLTGLSPDVLHLLEKLPDGDIEGVVYKPSEGAIIIQRPTPEAVDECITKFQDVYQKILSHDGQFKASDVSCSPLDPNYGLYFAAKLNSKHNQCVFVYLEEKNSFKLISNSHRHFEAAEKELNELMNKCKHSNIRPPLYAVKLGCQRVLTLKQNDVVAEYVEVIVNPANEGLMHGAGLAYALDAASGGRLQKVSRDYIATNGPVQVGDVGVTSSGGGALKCKYVYHAVGPRAFEYSPKDCARLIEQVVRRVLIIAEKNGIQSIALTAISSGIFGVDKDLVAQVIIDTVMSHQFSSRPPVLGDIRIVILDDDNFGCFCNYFTKKKRLPTGTIGTSTGADVMKRGSTGGGHVSTYAGAVGGIEYPELNSGALSGTDIDQPFQVGRGTTSGADSLLKHGGSKTDEHENCPICLHPLENSVAVNCCHKMFCKSCIEQALLHSGYCPLCKAVLRDGPLGNQPDGTMKVRRESSSLPGYHGCGTIVINYNFPDGTQGPNHPSPGQRYTGTSRQAYLPDNDEGREVLRLLEKAWNAKLVFTIGTSHTSGMSNTVVWNDIHHKTNTTGGVSAYGYPDNTYLSRVKEELAAKGIR